MHRLEEVLGHQKRSHPVTSIIVAENGTQQCLLGFQIMGRQAIGIRASFAVLLGFSGAQGRYGVHGRVAISCVLRLGIKSGF